MVEPNVAIDPPHMSLLISPTPGPTFGVRPPTRGGSPTRPAQARRSGRQEQGVRGAQEGVPDGEDRQQGGGTRQRRRDSKRFAVTVITRSSATNRHQTRTQTITKALDTAPKAGTTNVILPRSTEPLHGHPRSRGVDPKEALKATFEIFTHLKSTTRTTEPPLGVVDPAVT